MAVSGAKWMDQSYYESVPSSEVNWAQLAQHWMAMRDAGEVSNDSAFLPPPPPPLKNPAHHVPPPPHDANFIPPAPYFPPLPIDGPPPPSFPPPGHPPPPGWLPPPPPPAESNFGSSPVAAPYPPFVPPVPPWAAEESATVKRGGRAMRLNTHHPAGSAPNHPPYGGGIPSRVVAEAEHDKDDGGEYSHYYKEWDSGKQKADLNEGSSKESDEIEERDGVPQGAMAHWMGAAQWNNRQPSWFRNSASTASTTHNAQMPYIGPDSDSSEDEEETSNGNAKNESSFANNGEPVFKKINDSDDTDVEPVEVDPRSEEEKREDAVGFRGEQSSLLQLALLRRLMTELLLVTTDGELERICNEQLENATRKAAQPKILVKSSALAALSALGAESDSDESDDVHEGGTTKRSSEVGRAGASGEPVGSIAENEAAENAVVDRKSKAKLSSDDGRISPHHSLSAGEKSTRQSERRNKDETLANSARSGGGRSLGKECETTAQLGTDLQSATQLTADDEDRRTKFDNQHYPTDSVLKMKRKRSSKEGRKDASSPHGRSSSKRSRSKSKDRARRKARSRSNERKRRSRRKSSNTSRSSSKSSSNAASSDEESEDESRSRTPERYRRRSRSSSDGGRKKHRRSPHSRSHLSHASSHRRHEKRSRPRSRERRRSRSRSQSRRDTRSKRSRS
ncbi:unnamed protein product [Anisakis simplex]|uniref:Formin-like protein n=1 Tax=Anisakis simplex TaxID=6269 RepID=A0A0M3JZW4_ANISI|nr:unnamed protein product [Anisakis simplex]